MNSKTLGILAVVAVAVLAIAFWVARGRAPEETAAAPASKAAAPAKAGGASAGTPGSKLAESLAARVNDVAEITVRSGDKEASVKRDGARWVVPGRANFPADADKVRDAVLSIAELTISEPKTSKPENYSFLGVQDPGEKDSPSRLVTFKDAQGAPLAALIVGTVTPAAGSRAGFGVYVRRAGEAQAFEGHTRLDPRSTLEPDATSWIRKQLDGVPGDRVRSVTITHADGSTVEVVKGKKEDRDWTVANLPAGRELKYAGAATPIARAVSDVSFDDVKPVAEIAQGATPTGTAVFRTFDGLVLTVDTSTKDGTAWATFNARFEPVEQAAPEPTPSDQPPPAAPAAKSADDVKKEVDALNAGFAGWAFALPSFRVQQLLSKLDDLIKPVTPPPAPGESAGTPPGPILGDEPPPGLPDK